MNEINKPPQEKGSKIKELAGCLFCIGIPIVISLITLGIFYRGSTNPVLLNIVRVVIFVIAFIIFMLCIFPAIWHMVKDKQVRKKIT
ncbi:MAG: hypothetical protein ACFFA8_03950 [Promethearchaeota archaeon]